MPCTPPPAAACGAFRCGRLDVDQSGFTDARYVGGIPRGHREERDMRLPIDVAARVSPELSAIIDQLLNEPDIEEPVTLGVVRRRVAAGPPGEAGEPELVHSDRDQTLLGEIDALIGQYTDDAPALDFAPAKASEPLSRVIEALMSDANTPQRPTLGAVREALMQGVAARLAGEGAIEAEDEEALPGEVDQLIERFGPGALAEHLIRYE